MFLRLIGWLFCVVLSPRYCDSLMSTRCLSLMSTRCLPHGSTTKFDRIDDTEGHPVVQRRVAV